MLVTFGLPISVRLCLIPDLYVKFPDFYANIFPPSSTVPLTYSRLRGWSLWVVSVPWPKIAYARCANKGVVKKMRRQNYFVTFSFSSLVFFPVFFSVFILVRFLFLAFLWSSYFCSCLSVWFVNNRTLLSSLTSNVGGRDFSFLKMIHDALLFKVHFSSKHRRSHGE